MAEEAFLPSVLIFEAVTGGGFPEVDLPPSWVAEGSAIRRALVAEFAALVGTRVVEVVDARFAGDRPAPAGVSRIITQPDAMVDMARLARLADRVVVVAPETGGMLEELTRQLISAGGRSLGPAADAIALCADKLRLAEHFEAHGIPTPPTRWFRPEVDLPPTPSGRLLIKPFDGAGALNTIVLDARAGDRMRRDAPADSPFIVQPFRLGPSDSASFLVDRTGQAHLIAVGRQNVTIDADGRLTYQGGELPVACDDVDLELVRRAVESVAGLLGFVGVDFVVSPDGRVEVIEINPRVTTSIVALARLVPLHWLARAWLAAVDGPLGESTRRDLRAIQHSLPVRFLADGTILARPEGLAMSVNNRLLAFDIGGANLKAAHSAGSIQTVAFELWKHPDELASSIRSLAATLPDADGWLITMTGELCDCFRTRADGVRSILRSVEAAAAGRLIRVWGTDGAFHQIDAILPTPLIAAASNWLALATVVARGDFGRSGLLIDIGSTTTDLIPWRDGEVLIPIDRRTDFDRLQARTLVYSGTRRTPLMAFRPICFHRTWVYPMAELFATTADVYLTLNDLSPDPDDRSTANGRPFTVDESRDRLARMLGRDRDEFTPEEAQKLAKSYRSCQLLNLGGAAADVALRFFEGREGDRSATERIGTLIVAGSGEFLARRMVDRLGPETVVRSLNDAWGREASEAACAVALLRLMAEGGA